MHLLKKKQGYISYDEYIDSLKKIKLDVDTYSLKKSRRCGKGVADFVHKKFKIQFESYDNHNGEIIVIDDLKQIEKIINDNNIIKLVFNNAKNKKYKAINWSYSKGNTYEDICVILTEDTDAIVNEDFSKDAISLQTLNKLYVAITRASRNVYLIKKKDIDLFEKNTRLNLK